MTLKEKFDKLIPIEFGGMQDPLLSNCVEVAEEFAIEFALFLSDNIYENYYQDLDGDGKTWVSYYEQGFDDYSTANRLTIQEVLERFKKEKGL